MSSVIDASSDAAFPHTEAPQPSHSPHLARLVMADVDSRLRTLDYETRTATLLNLLVTYAAEQPAASIRRGKFINAMVEEFRKRLQMFLPISTGDQR